MATISIIEDRPVLYVNVVIEDASEAIKAGVSEKIEDCNLPSKLKKRLRHIGKFAADKISAARIVNKMAPKMVKEMPVKMKKKGLTVHAEEVFRDGAFFVIQMQVQHVDAAVMLEAKQLAGDEVGQERFAVKFVRWFLGAMGVTLADTVQTDYLPDLIQKKMQPSMGEMMEEEMAEKKMKASVEVLPEKKQARFFYALLQQVRDAEAARKEAKKISPSAANPYSSLKSRKSSTTSK
jgi:hypothetical protein